VDSAFFAVSFSDRGRDADGIQNPLRAVECDAGLTILDAARQAEIQ